MSAVKTNTVGYAMTIRRNTRRYTVMKIDAKETGLAAILFVCGFVLSWVLLGPSEPRQRNAPVLASRPVLAPAQFPPQTLYLVVSGVHSPGPRLSISADPFGEIELMKHRSVDLIDTHYQPKIDWQEPGR